MFLLSAVESKSGAGPNGSEHDTRRGETAEKQWCREFEHVRDGPEWKSKKLVTEISTRKFCGDRKAAEFSEPACVVHRVAVHGHK